MRCFNFRVSVQIQVLCIHLQLTLPFYLLFFTAMKSIQPFAKLLLTESFLRKENPGINWNSGKNHRHDTLQRGGKGVTFRCSSKSISKVNGGISKGPLVPKCNLQLWKSVWGDQLEGKNKHTLCASLPLVYTPLTFSSHFGLPQRFSSYWLVSRGGSCGQALLLLSSDMKWRVLSSLNPQYVSFNIEYSTLSCLHIVLTQGKECEGQI